MGEVEKRCVVKTVSHHQKLLSFLDVSTQQLALYVLQLLTQTRILLTHAQHAWLRKYVQETGKRKKSCFFLDFEKKI